jgi:hypothetical protein
MLMHGPEFSQIKIFGHLVLTFSLFNFLFWKNSIDFFPQCWGLNPGPCAYQARAPSLR